MEDLVAQCLGKLGSDLITRIKSSSKLVNFRAGEMIVKENTIIRNIPIVIEGCAKVYTERDIVPFHLYYINAGEPCIFSFAHTFSEHPLAFSAVAEIDSTLLLISLAEAEKIFDTYPLFSRMILNAYQKHYNQLLTTTISLSTASLEERLMDYLVQKSAIKGEDTLHISHSLLAENLGSSREVISRLLKKKEHEGKLLQVGRKIKML